MSDLNSDLVQEQQSGLERRDFDEPSDANRNTCEYSREVIDTPEVASVRSQTIQHIANACRDAGVSMYQSDRTEKIEDDRPLPFRLSPSPFRLPDLLREKLPEYGRAISAFYFSARDIYESLPADHRWKRYLDHSKPDHLTTRRLVYPHVKTATTEHVNVRGGESSATTQSTDILSMKSQNPPSAHHLFLRPDFILSDQGAFVTEIETSPFGFPLSIFLNQLYQNSGHATLSAPQDHVVKKFAELLGLKPGQRLVFLITEQTAQYGGQFEYLSRQLEGIGIRSEVFFPENIHLEGGEIYDSKGEKIDMIYKGFYTYQSVDSPLLHKLTTQHHDRCFPATYPQLEEKALMGMVHDPEFEPVLRVKLGNDFDTLKAIIPGTFVLDRCTPPDQSLLPVKQWTEIADLPASQRNFVLKPSGFTKDSSWSKGVQFLAKLSKKRCRDALDAALASGSTYILQEFRKGSVYEQTYYDFGSRLMKQMRGRVRFTPYFLVSNGELLTAKATMCADTDYIHGMVDAINGPVI